MSRHAAEPSTTDWNRGKCRVAQNISVSCEINNFWTVKTKTEKQNENLHEDLCKILRESVSIELAPADILAIHRIPGRARDGPRPVIAKFRDPETKVRIIKKRSQEKLKKHFAMYDHITAMNSKLIRDLNEDSRIHSAWYFNGKVFGIDSNGNRHRFDILDDIHEKLKQRR